jgi:hypothetical protein
MKPCRSLPVACWLILSFPNPADVQSNTPSIAALGELTKPAKRIPFKEVILAITQHRILDFDNQNAAHRILFQKLSTAAAAAETKARTQGIFTTRANEAGNHMEIFVKAALQEAGLPARTPVTTKGEAQTTGLSRCGNSERPALLSRTQDLQRHHRRHHPAFFLLLAFRTSESHLRRPAFTPRLLLAYELEKTTRAGKPAFIPVHWKLITLQDLQVDLKFEFNQSNRGLYGKEAGKAILAESQKVKDR